ncbi:hypothetical protein THMIRHAM_18850 [Thiomicrorhabdus immobilis]|uniref:EAL domain-containing protein n=1 Tax=Thiomicrorhabdus immobilis TaxID=2791037 RepID=A0ABN6CYM9_9GAMM|nr:EAL domain-containing protein [Thiomicrorhabdus immobilis]BCN94100.1 hypothetical protein THMIRHAM_18850 [Thiomicrorhabdus immobilis]
MLKQLYLKSIKFKLIVAIALLHAILMSIFVLDLVNRQQTFLLEESKQATTGIAKTLAANSIPWVLSKDLAGLEEILNTQAQQSNLVFTMITNSKGKILAYYHRTEPTTDVIGKSIEFPAPQPDNDILTFTDSKSALDIAVPIKIESTVIGWARIHMSRANIDKSVQLVTLEGLVYALIAILIGTFFAWRMGRNLTKDINTLVEATHRVRSGERDITLSLKREDELQILSENFQDMLGNLNNKEKELHSEKELLETTLKSIGDGVISTNKDGLITYLNPAAETLTGWSNSQAYGLHIEQVFKIHHETSMEKVANPALLGMEKRKTINLPQHTILIDRHEQKISIEDSGAPIIDKAGNIVGSVLVFHDATEERDLKKRLTWQALHDSLTSLKNRQAFENELDELIERSVHQQTQNHCLLYIDLDQFKIINDTVGHSAGDEQLKQVASILREHVRETDLLARIGGDEFAILLENCSLENALRIAENIRVAVHQHRFLWKDRIFDIGTSIGITQMRGFFNRATAMSQADIACYIAKDSGRNRIHVYNEENQAFSNLDWANRIKRSLEDEKFILYAQKIIPLQNKGNHIYEVLVRLQDGENIITPDQFLPAAERFNLMSDLDLYIVRHAYKWLEEHFTQVDRININISGQSLSNPDFSNKLLAILENYDHLNRKICFEVLETTAITHMSASISFLQRIKTHGCQLALDDFGSGFSSFGWLKTLPVDYVKIDGAFILDILNDPIDAAMVKAIHQISDHMNIETIAEFVENQEVADWLTNMGIDYAQGYHFHKPSPLNTILESSGAVDID